jgi:hypothetical protein
MATDHPMAKAAILCLGDEWPQILSFREVLRRAYNLIEADSSLDPTTLDQHGAVLSDILLAAYAGGLIDLHMQPSCFLTVPSTRPAASPVVRLQLQTNTIVTTLRHTNLSVDDELARHLLLRLDGTRTRGTLLVELNSLLAVHELASPHEPTKRDLITKITPERLEQKLQEVARLALLVT